MAITACFAGPIFNLLVGLGLGFSIAFRSQGVNYIDVTLPPTIMVGFGFLILNCFAILYAGRIANKNSLTKRFAYVGATIYIGYLITALVVAFTFPQ